MPNLLVKLLRWCYKFLHYQPLFCAVDFAGDADSINLGTGFNASSFSISFFMNPDSAASWSRVCSKYTGGNVPVSVWALIRSSTGRYYFSVCTADGEFTTWDEAADTQVTSMSHICLTFNGSDTIVIYINGVAKKTYSSVTGTINSTATQASIARSTDGGPWSGVITDFAFWDSLLTTEEIKLLSDSKIKGMPLQIQPDNLVLYLPLDDYPEGTAINGLTFKDQSGNGNHGIGLDANDNSTVVAETVLSYPTDAIYVDAQASGDDEENATYSSVSLTLTVPSITATYTQAESATFTAVALSLTVPSMTASTSQAGSATFTPVSLVLTPPSQTATYVQEESATFDAVALSLTVPSTTSSYTQEESATFTAVPLSLTVVAQTATTAGEFTSLYTTLSLALTVPSNTASYTQEESAVYDALSLLLTVPSMTASGIAGVTAAYSPVALTLTVPNMTARRVGCYGKYQNDRMEYFHNDTLVWSFES